LRADYVARLVHHIFWAALKKLFDGNNCDTLFAAIGDVLAVIHCPPYADLNNAFWIQQTFFDCTAKGCAMGVFEASEIAVKQVGMRVEMDHAHRTVLCQSTQHR